MTALRDDGRNNQPEDDDETPKERRQRLRREGLPANDTETEEERRDRLRKNAFVVPTWMGNDMILTIQEVAQILRVNVQAVYRINKVIEEARIPMSKWGKQCRYRHNDLANWLLNQHPAIKGNYALYRYDRPVSELPRLWPPQRWPIDPELFKPEDEEREGDDPAA